jgi:aminoglycoside phosphotransferase
MRAGGAVVTSAPQRTAALAPDPALPGRDDLLDGAQVGARLRQAMGERALGSCTRVRATYRRGESLRATYRLEAGGGTQLVSARMFTASRAPDKFVEARDAAVRRGASSDSVLLDASLDTVFWVFPEDRKLRGLAELLTPSAATRAVFAEPWSRSELLAYTPEKAATARCEDAAGGVVGYAKVQLGDEGRRSVAVLRAARRGITQAGPLRLPDAVGYLRDRHMALFSPAPGRPLHELPRDRLPEAMSALGTGLGVLHRQRAAGFPAFERLGPDRLIAAGDVLRRARPDLTSLVQSLVEALLVSAPAPGEQVLLHGDLHPKNVLVHDEGISLVDLDQAGTGPAAAELGAMLSRLWCPRPGDETPDDTAAAAADALVASYGRRAPGHRDLLWYAAAALLVERAARAVHRVDMRTLAVMDQVLATALSWTAERGDRP